MALISSINKQDADKIIKELYQDFERKTGDAPEWLKVMAHRPEIAKEFTELFKAIMIGPGAIPTELRWKIGYVVSKELKCPFCIDVSVKMLATMGADAEDIESLGNQDGLNKDEARILDLVRDVTQDGHLDNPEIFEELRKRFTEAQIVEIVSVIGFFNYINRFNNTLGVLPD